MLLLFHCNSKYLHYFADIVCAPNALLAIALDSTKMTTEAQFTLEKTITTTVLRIVRAQYSLAIYTSDDAWIYTDFGQNTSLGDLNLDNLTYHHSKSYGFPYKKLFSLDYNRSPDCLWLFRNKENYTYPKNSGLPDKPMGYDVQIPKIVLEFGKPMVIPGNIHYLTYISDLQYNTFDISVSTQPGHIDKLRDSICKFCSK